MQMLSKCVIFFYKFKKYILRCDNFSVIKNSVDKKIMQRQIARRVKYRGEYSSQIFEFVSILSSYEIASENNSIIVLRQRDAFLQMIIYPREESFIGVLSLSEAELL